MLIIAWAIIPLLIFLRAARRVSVDRSVQQQAQAAKTNQANQKQQAANIGRDRHPDNITVSLASDADGNIWVGTEHEGVFRYNPSEDKWTQFTTEDGLGDNNAYAIACDKQRRIWVGELNHGVAVFNGEKWTNYNILDGPIGERVFRIAVCPTDGDVWMATSAGLTRYSVTHDTWQYFTRADGLPSDQANALAFDKDGNLYVGTQCDGIAIGLAANHYQHWRVIRSVDFSPTNATGDGLPTDLINDMLVGRNGTVYAATTTGLAYSIDQGNVWHYIRGRDFAGKVEGLANAPENWIRPSKGELGSLLPEDFVTCLAEDMSGHIWLGFREQGYAMVELRPFHSRFRISPARSMVDYVRAMLFNAGSQPYIASYGAGFLNAENISRSAKPSVVSSAQPANKRAAPFPSPEKPPVAAELVAMLNTIQNLPYQQTDDICPDETNGIYLGQDWRTQGDWLGRYGRQDATLSAMAAPLDHNCGWAWHITIGAKMGPHHTMSSRDMRGREDSLRYFVEKKWLYTKESRALYSPVVGHRRMAEWDDHGEAYPMTYQGPDVWISVSVPEGIHKLSFYFVNFDGQIVKNRFRDYLLELKPYVDDPKDWEKEPTLAKSRVQDFFDGEYQSFIVSGPAKYNLKVGRNYSFNTMCSGVFVDQLLGPGSPAADGSWLPYMEDVRYGAPDVPAPDHKGEQDAITDARALWKTLDDAYTSMAGVKNQYEMRLSAYRAAVRAHAPELLLANWRWKMLWWTTVEREQFLKVVQKAYAARQATVKR